MVLAAMVLAPVLAYLDELRELEADAAGRA
jgi:hypothetical protein